MPHDTGETTGRKPAPRSHRGLWHPAQPCPDLAAQKPELGQRAENVVKLPRGALPARLTRRCQIPENRNRPLSLQNQFSKCKKTSRPPQVLAAACPSRPHP